MTKEDALTALTSKMVSKRRGLGNRMTVKGPKMRVVDEMKQRKLIKTSQA